MKALMQLSQMHGVESVKECSLLEQFIEISLQKEIYCLQSIIRRGF